MEKLRSLKVQLVKQFLLLYAVLLAFLLARWDLSGAYGLTFGTLMAALNFFLLASTLEKSVQMNPHRARVFVTAHYFIRYALFFVVLLIAIQRADMNFVWAVVGLLIPKAVILGGNFVDIFRRRFNPRKT